MIFDTHAHYDDEQFDADRDALLAAMPDAGVGLILDPGCDLDTSRRAVELAERYPHVCAAVGYHPENCAPFVPSDIDVLRELAKRPKVVAIGEIGLDYHYDKDWEIKQKEYFDAQLSLSEELCLPVIIHDRDAHGDVFDMIRAHPKARGIIHSCSESAEMVKEYVKMGWYISFSGVITFKNASKILESVKATPKDRILVETDCPYLAPVPMRGRDNTSAYLHFTAEKAAEVLGIDYDEFVRVSTDNAKRVYGIR